MWAVLSNDITMTEGDYGVALPVTVSGTTLASSDSVKISIMEAVNGAPILEKTFTDISRNTFNLELTEAETALLPVGNYVYRLDWYNAGVFMCNIIKVAWFKVVEKA